MLQDEGPHCEGVVCKFQTYPIIHPGVFAWRPKNCRKISQKVHCSYDVLLLWMQTTDSSLRLAISNAVSYLESKLSEVSEDPYALNIISYALTLAQSSRASDALHMLNSLAIVEGIITLPLYSQM